MNDKTNHTTLFHLRSAADLFYCLERALNRYEASRAKQIEDLMFLIMGLTHLREWIAPGYKHETPPTSPEQEFFQRIYDYPDFDTVRKLCNRTKHLAEAPGTDFQGNLNIDEWPNFDAVLSMDDGPPTAFYVDGKEVGTMLRRLAEFYRNEWFSHQDPEGKT